MGNHREKLKAAARGLGVALGLVVALATASLARQGQATITTPASPEDITLHPQVYAIAKELRCPICQGLSVADSPTDLATQMRALIAERLEAGESPEAIKAYFASKYGDWILLKPKRRGISLLVWLLPVAGLAVGGCVIVFFTRRSMRRAVPPKGEAPEAEVVGHYAERLEQEMEEFDS